MHSHEIVTLRNDRVRDLLATCYETVQTEPGLACLPKSYASHDPAYHPFLRPHMGVVDSGRLIGWMSGQAGDWSILGLCR